MRIVRVGERVGEACLCPKEIAGMLGIAERTAQRLMQTGELEAFKVGRLWRTERMKVDQYRTRQYERYRRALPRAA